MKTTILRIIGLFFAFGLFLWASSEDYKETVIYNMPNSVYVEICNNLGHECTRKQIVNEYMSNREYYDSLKFQ